MAGLGATSLDSSGKLPISNTCSPYALPNETISSIAISQPVGNKSGSGSPVTPEEQIFNVDPQNGELCQGLVNHGLATPYSTSKIGYETPKPSPYTLATPVSVRKPVPNQYLRTVDSKQSLRSVKSNMSFSVPRKPTPSLRSPLQAGDKLTDSPLLLTTRSSSHPVPPLSLISSPPARQTQPLVIPPSTPSSHALRGCSSFTRTSSESQSALSNPSSEFGGRKQRTCSAEDTFSPAFVVGKSQSAMSLPLPKSNRRSASISSARASTGTVVPPTPTAPAPVAPAAPTAPAPVAPAAAAATSTAAASTAAAPPTPSGDAPHSMLSEPNFATNKDIPSPEQTPPKKLSTNPQLSVSPLKTLSNVSPRRRPEPLTNIRNPLRAPSVGHSQIPPSARQSDYFGSQFDNSVFAYDGGFSATSSTFSERSLSSAGSMISTRSVPPLDNPFPGITKSSSEPPFSSGEALFPGANVFPGIGPADRLPPSLQPNAEAIAGQMSPVSANYANSSENSDAASLTELKPISAGTPIAARLLWEKVGQNTGDSDENGSDSLENDEDNDFSEEDTTEHLLESAESNCVMPRPSLYRDAVAQVNEPQISRVVHTGMAMFPLKIVTAVDANIEQNRASVVLQLQVPNRSGRVVWLGKNYCSSVKDIERSYSAQRQVKGYSVNGRELAHVKTGPLRFESRVSILHPKSGQYLCSDAEVMLFSELLVIVKDNQVIAAIDVNAHLRRAKVDKSRPRVLKLRFKVPSPRNSPHNSPGHRRAEFNQGIDLKLGSTGEAFAWECAVSDRKQEFPLCADVKPEFLAKLESEMEILNQHDGKTTERLPAEIAICVSQLYLAGDAKLGRQINDIIRDTLCPEDRVSVLVYTENGEVMDSMPLQAPQWAGWERYLNRMARECATINSHMSLGGQKPSATLLDTVIFEAKNMLHSKQYRSGTASIVLITNDKIELGSTLAMFQTSDVAVCSVGVGAKLSGTALTSLAHATGGNYSHAVDNEELYKVLRTVITNESRYVFRNLMAHLRPRLGAQITSVCRNDYQKWPVPLLGNSNQPLKIEFGAMRAGDTKCVVVDMVGGLISSQPLFQTGIEAEIPTQHGDSQMKKLYSERILTPSLSDHESSPSLAIINTEKIMIAMHEALSATLTELNQGDIATAHTHVKEFHCRGRDLAQNVWGHDGLTPEVRCVIDVLLQEMKAFDELCFESTLSTQDLARLALHYLWLIEERRARSPDGVIATKRRESRGGSSKPVEKTETENHPSPYDPKVHNSIRALYKHRPAAYLDNAAAPLVLSTIPHKFADFICSQTLVNPHSNHALGTSTQSLIDEVRNKVLYLLNADPADYEVVFCANATAGLKLVGEGDLSNRQFTYHLDSHTSVIGLRALAQSYSVFTNDRDLENLAENSVVAWPLQSNFDGFNYPGSEWVEKIRSQRCLSLIDIASYAATKMPNFRDVRPDFAVLSFYKIFGMPDLGALIVRKSPETTQFFHEKRYFGGGTVAVLAPIQPYVVRPIRLADQLEDGTLPLHNIAMLKIAIDEFRLVYTDFRMISDHTLSVANYLRNRLKELMLVTVLGTPNSPIVTFIPVSPEDSQTKVGHNEFVTAANLAGVFVRAGTLCNIGGFLRATHMSEEKIIENHEKYGKKCNDEISFIDNQPTGVVRASFGPYSNTEDADRLVEIVKEVMIQRTSLPFIDGNRLDLEPAKVKDLFIYPIKSCSGLRLTQSLMTSNGLHNDRMFCVVELATTRIMSLKRFRTMIFIKPFVSGNFLIVNFDSGSYGTIQDSPVAQISVPLNTEDWPHKNTCDDLQMCLDPLVIDFFSKSVGIPCTIAKQVIPPVNLPTESRRTELETRQSSNFANSSPLLIVTTSSAQDLEIEDINVFRPNIVLETKKPWAEDQWRGIRHNSLAIEMLGKCRRCNMVCVTVTGQTNSFPYMQLCRKRKMDGKLYFGQHASIHNGVYEKNSSIWAVGDTVQPF